jgi:hypothetical protein
MSTSILPPDPPNPDDPNIIKPEHQMKYWLIAIMEIGEALGKLADIIANPKVRAGTSYTTYVATKLRLAANYVEGKRS